MPANIELQWISVAGTLLGAGIGFAGSYFATKLNRDKEAAYAKEARDRERVERIYRILVGINAEKMEALADAINFIHHATPLNDKNVKEFPPLIELEMLYFPELETSRNQLQEAIHAFTKKYIEFRFPDYRKKTLEKKQKDSGVLARLSTQIDDSVTEMQQALIGRAKA